eukprot:scaffold331_cov117-Cylindrotheca_fusiformis.AAC.14
MSQHLLDPTPISMTQFHGSSSSCLCACLDGGDEQKTQRITLDRQPPSLQDEMKETEAFLAAEMNKLSMQEISKALDDVHCVGEELEEDPDSVSRALFTMDQMVRAEKDYFYELAASQDRSFVENRSFRLKFLRVNFYDVKRSVRQMMNFLKHKATYFGADNLGREIELSDLTHEELNLITSGLFHVQQGRDKSGRVIVYMLNHKLHLCTVNTLIRVTFYIFYNLLVSIPEVQTKGLAGIYYDSAKPGDKFIQLSLQAQMKINSVIFSIPFRHSSLHMCIKGTAKGNLELNNALLRLLLSAFPRYARVRTRLHYGSDIELQYHLQSHGIPMKYCPVDSSGEIRQDILNIWFEDFLVELQSKEGSNVQQQRPSNESTTSHVSDSSLKSLESTPIQSLRPMDVILGRGRGCQNHPGNIRFRAFLEGYRQQYDSVHLAMRREMATDLCRMLKSNGIRFLKLNDDLEWVECDAEAVQTKISQLFRSMRKQKRVHSGRPTGMTQKRQT